jgi:uncharacterized protein (DUF1499 family)
VWRGVALVVSLLAACGPPDHVGGLEGDLAPCPDTPSCVHTGLRHPDGTEGIFAAETALIVLRPGILEAMASLPGATVVEDRTTYFRAEVKRGPFRVDDLEVLILPDGEIVVRSAARRGDDRGANVARVAELRERLRAAGLAH